MSLKKRLTHLISKNDPSAHFDTQTNQALVDLFSLDRPLIHFSKVDPWTIRDACEGVAIFGSIGSGKTSGSGASLAKAYLRAGFGGLILCAKPEERALFEKYAKETGRSDSLVIISPDSETQWKFNFLDYEMRRAGRGSGQAENFVNLLSNVVEIVEGKVSQTGDSSFWNRGRDELLRNAVDLLMLSEGTVTLRTLARLIASAPRSLEQVDEDKHWEEKSFLSQCLKAAHERKKTESQTLDLEATRRYWTQLFAGMDDKPRSGIVATLSGVTDILSHGFARDFLTTTTNLVPEVTYKDGAVIVLDVPIQEYQQVGRVIQGIFKLAFQRAILRRDAGNNPRPVFLWQDEYQNFASGFDYQVQAVARSARLCTVALTQSISNLYTVLGKREETDALLGNFQTKIFHANSDPSTNHYAAELIAQTWQTTNSWNSSQNPQGQPTPSVGGSESVQYEVLPSVFTTLRKGGATNRNEVEGIVFQGGRRWRSNGGRTFLQAVFRQG